MPLNLDRKGCRHQRRSLPRPASLRAPAVARPLHLRPFCLGAPLLALLLAACAAAPRSAPPAEPVPIEAVSAVPAGSGWRAYRPPPPAGPPRRCTRTAPGPDGTFMTVEVPCPKVF